MNDNSPPKKTPRRWRWVVAGVLAFVSSYARYPFGPIGCRRILLLVALVWLLGWAAYLILPRIRRGRWSPFSGNVSILFTCSLIIVCSMVFHKVSEQSLTEHFLVQCQRVERRIKRELWPIASPRWTTSQFHGTPEPPPALKSQLAFSKLNFHHPIAMSWIPIVERWVLAEEQGRIVSFSDARNTDQLLQILDLKRVIWGMAVHPQFHLNGYLFVSYMDAGTMRVVRFTTNKTTGMLDPESQSAVIEWPQLGHEGGCLDFGLDGCLYVSVGDSGAYDSGETGQDISDLYGSILRLDVDHPTANNGYSVPSDNPFVGMEGARPEVWSYGLRQVWKMSFDRVTGELWAGDVGQDLWESIHLIRRGGNCGWSIFEGAHPLFPDRKKGPTPIIPPVVEQSHSVMRSITGGHVYRGSKLPLLQGLYLYGDYDTGTVWSIQRDRGQTIANQLIADTPLRISSFTIDKSGEVLIVDHIGGQIFELTESTPEELKYDHQFPRKLSQTELFASTAEHRPQAGVLPYSVNSPLWADGADKDRFLAVPEGASIDFEGVPYENSVPGWDNWGFPDGTALVKTFSLETERGNPHTRRRVETRVMIVENLPEDPNHRYKASNKLWHGYSYVWSEDQTDAELVDAEGLDQEFEIRDATSSKRHKQVWHFPSRFECMMCHTRSAGFVLGVSTAQLNRFGLLGHGGLNQLDFLDRARLIDRNASAAPPTHPMLPDPADTHLPVELRARSYLHANCAHCHRPYGGGNGKLDLRFHASSSEMNALEERPVHGTLGVDDAFVIKPGDPERSMLYHRMTTLNAGRMPKAGSSEVDHLGAQLIYEWIQQLNH